MLLFDSGETHANAATRLMGPIFWQMRYHPQPRSMSLIIPHDQLQPDTLIALIEEFITRHGDVSGHTDTPFDRQIAAVKRQLHSGEAVIVYEEELESCSIRLKTDLGRRGPGR